MFQYTECHQGVVFSLVIVRVGLGISSENRNSRNGSMILSDHGFASLSHPMTIRITKETRDDSPYHQKSRREPWETDQDYKVGAGSSHAVVSQYWLLRTVGQAKY